MTRPRSAERSSEGSAAKKQRVSGGGGEHLMGVSYTGAAQSSNGYPAPTTGSHPITMIGSALQEQLPSPEAAKSRVDMPSYYGPTSFSAIFQENKLGSAQEIFSRQATDAIYEEYDPSKSPFPRETSYLEAPEHVDKGVGVLEKLPNRRLCESFLDRYFTLCDVIVHEQTMRQCHDSLWSSYDNCLVEPRRTALLASMSKELCRNATTPLPSSASIEEWIASFSGHRLRWEVLGNFFALFGIAAMIMPEWDPLFANEYNPRLSNKKRYGSKMRECAEACLALCNDVDSVNDHVISLMMGAYSLQSFYEGDASQQLWRRFGGLFAAVTAMGLHRETDPAYSPTSSLSPPFLVSEYRRRLFSIVFFTDKQLATFMGRPPALSRRYSSCRMPLDLTDKQMMATGLELEMIKNRLDPNGWNTTEEVSPNTICRAWMCMSLIRDEILELSLGHIDDTLNSRREELKRRCEDTYAQMPKAFHYNPDDPDVHTLGAFRFSLKIANYQEWLLNRFLLDRLPDGGSVEIKQDLVDTARKMLDGVLVLCANRDRLADFTVGFTWAITYSGIPAAAILSVELLKQSKFPHDWRPILPRSEVIQNLSVFIGCLEWVRPSAGNYELCVKMRKVIKRILDQVLEMPPPNPQPEVPTAPDFAPPDIAVSSILGPEDEPDFLEWLNSVDWTRDMLQDAWT